MSELAHPMLKNQYSQYLLWVIDEVKEYGNQISNNKDSWSAGA